MKKELKDQFLLSKEYTFLNHGSFGACPKPVFEDYQHWQLELERKPVQFMMQEGPAQLEISKKALASYIDCDPNDIVLTTNPSYAMNIIAKSLKLNPGDEILSTNLEYGAMDRTWKYYCKKAGARYIQQEIPLPLLSVEAFEETFWKGYNSNTKIIFISHITSATGLILPVDRICRRAKELGLITIVDGAHVPGHIPLDLSNLQADIYTGACHKWLLTPKGCSFLYVKKSMQNDFDPLVISWGYDSDVPGISQFIDYHQQQGTRDYSAFLTIPAAISFLNTNNWESVSAECRTMVKENNEELAEILNTQLLCPNNDVFLGQMCSLEIRTPDPLKLKALLFEKYCIEIPVMSAQNKVYLRFSIQVYNDQENLDYLKRSLKEINMSTNLLVL